MKKHINNTLNYIESHPLKTIWNLIKFVLFLTWGLFLIGMLWAQHFPKR